MALVTPIPAPYTEVMIHVLIVDEHEPVRRALKALLQHAEDVQVVKSTGRYAQAIDDARLLLPDVILLETKTSVGLTTLKALRDAAPHAAVIVLTSYPDSREEEQVLALGAAAYLLKTLDSQMLLQAIRQLGALVVVQRRELQPLEVQATANELQDGEL